jgi:RimJ/RimL family protein N-acetyltransferase
VIETDRLILRPWRDVDLAPFAAINADPQVADWLGGPMTFEQSDAYVARERERFEAQGFCRFALERREDGRLIGSVGLAPVHPSLAFGGLEIGWRLARDAWGHGYASEAAEATTRDAFVRFGFEEIVSFTAEANLRSQAVMRRIGFERAPERDFDNPNLPAGHPLVRHIVYVRLRPA